ncbi:MAG: hypothetical protein D6814_02730 [Calditrichaeota bacterium]|nr:MAG: hypothetical protein D6814_02730 [Calditrichota bacterium]
MNRKEQSNHGVIPTPVYLAVGAALLLLTGLTVAVSFVHLGPFNLVVAMLIATLKASLVALFFMHLFYDNKLYMTVFLTAITFLGVFIILTMFDTMRRDDIYEEVAHPIKKQAVIYEKLKADSTATSHEAKPSH